MSTAYRDCPGGDGPPPCCHCFSEPAECRAGTNHPRRRGLCDGCYSDPEIRALYTPRGAADGGCLTADCHGHPYRRGLCRQCYQDAEKRAAAPPRPDLGASTVSPADPLAARDLAALLRDLGEQPDHQLPFDEWLRLILSAEPKPRAASAAVGDAAQYLGGDEAAQSNRVREYRRRLKAREALFSTGDPWSRDYIAREVACD